MLSLTLCMSYLVCTSVLSPTRVKVAGTLVNIHSYVGVQTTTLC